METKKSIKPMFLLLSILIIFSPLSMVFGEGTSKRKLNINENIKVEKWGSDKTHVAIPGGLVVLDDTIYVTDKEDNVIVVLDKEGNFQGQSSEDDLFLFEPSIIKTDGESLYVVDSGLNQLKIITKDFELLETYNLPVLSLVEYVDFEIVNKKFYLSSNAVREEEAVIYELDRTGTFRKMGNRFYGYLSEFNGELMAVNTLQYYSGKDENGRFMRGAKSGKNSLFKVQGDRLVEKFKFIDKYTSLDFILMNDYIYVFSAGYVELAKYTRDGQYIETLCKVKESSLSVQMDSYDDTILLSDQREKIIYKIDLK